MYNLIKCEILKLKKSREFSYIFWGICIISIILMVNKIYVMEEFLKHMNMEEAVSGINSFTELISGKMYILILENLLVIYFICHDFENGIVKSEDLAGYSRFQILISKTVMCFVINFILTLFFVLICTIGVSLIYGFGLEITGNVICSMAEMFILSVLISCSISSMAVLISYLFRTLSVSIAVWIGIFFIVPIVFSMITDIFKISKAVELAINNLNLEFFDQITMDMSTGDALYITSMCMLRIIVLISVTYLLFRKSELK